MMQYTKFDQRKPFTLIEIKELLMGIGLNQNRKLECGVNA